MKGNYKGKKRGTGRRGEKIMGDEGLGGVGRRERKAKAEKDGEKERRRRRRKRTTTTMMTKRKRRKLKEEIIKTKTLEREGMKS